MSAFPQSHEAAMDDEIGLLKLRVAKFPPKLLRDHEAARLALLNGGWVTAVFARDAVRTQDMAMVKLNDGRIVSGIPVKDLQVCG